MKSSLFTQFALVAILSFTNVAYGRNILDREATGLSSSSSSSQSANKKSSSAIATSRSTTASSISSSGSSSSYTSSTQTTSSQSSSASNSSSSSSSSAPSSGLTSTSTSTSTRTKTTGPTTSSSGIIPTTTLATTQFSASALPAIPSATTPVLTTSTASNGNLVPFLYIPAAVLGTQGSSVIAALGGTTGEGIGIFGPIFGSLPAAALDIPSIAGVALDNPVVYDPDSVQQSTTGKNEPTSSSSTTTTTTTAPAQTAALYVVSTKRGTSMTDYSNFIKTFPDEGKGVQIAYSLVSFQSYITSMNSSYAATVAQNPLVDSVVIDVPISEEVSSDVLPQATSAPGKLKKEKRAQQPPLPPPPSNNLVRQTNAQTPLKIISQGIPNNLKGTLGDYQFDPIAGEGITIYVLDSGFFVGATDFNFDTSNWAPDEDYHLVAANILNEQDGLGGNFPNQNSLTETKPHGTCVASMAVGETWGVAKNAKMIPVKFKNEASTRPAALVDAFNWVVEDVKKKELEGKAVINLSYGFSTKTGPYGITDELFTELLEECWDNGIVTVVAAGNEGQLGKKLGQTVPQSLGKSSNPLITVGGINNDGSLWTQTTPEGSADGSGQNPGSITVSLAANVECASYNDPTGTQTQPGTSFAAPQVAGLAAYFMSLPSLNDQFQSGGMTQVAQRVKNYIVQAAYHRGSNSNPLSPYNLAEDALCVASDLQGRALQERAPQEKALPKRDDPTLQTILSSGTIVATGITAPCSRSTTTGSFSTSSSTSISTSTITSTSTKTTSSTSTSTSSSSSSYESLRLGCATSTVAASAIPTNLAVGSNITAFFDDMRTFICDGSCGQPPIPAGSYDITWDQSSDNSSCLIVVSMWNPQPGIPAIEGYIYRGTSPSNEIDKQNCLNATGLIISQCIKNGPNNGWVNGAGYDFWQAGFSPLNAPAPGGLNYTVATPSPYTLPATTTTMATSTSTTSTSSSTPTPSGASFHVTYLTWNDDGQETSEFVLLPSYNDNCDAASSNGSYLSVGFNSGRSVYPYSLLESLPVSFIQSSCGERDSNITVSQQPGGNIVFEDSTTQTTGLCYSNQDSGNSTCTPSLPGPTIEYTFSQLLVCQAQSSTTYCQFGEA